MMKALFIVNLVFAMDITNALNGLNFIAACVLAGLIIGQFVSKHVN